MRQKKPSQRVHSKETRQDKTRTNASERTRRHRCQISVPAQLSPCTLFWAPLCLLKEGHCSYNKELDMRVREKTTLLAPRAPVAAGSVVDHPSFDFDPPTPTPHSSPSHTHTYSASGTAPGNMPRKRKASSSPDPPKRATRKSGGALVEGLIKERDPHAFEDAEHEFLAITTHRYVCCCPSAFLLNRYIFIPLHVVSNPFLLPSLAYIPLIGNDSREIPNPSSCG